MTVGERIKSKRLELGLSQDELAKRCGYKSRSSINKIELSRSLPLNKVTLMAKALGCSESSLMGWTEDVLMQTHPVYRAMSHVDNSLKEEYKKHLIFNEMSDEEFKIIELYINSDPQTKEIVKRVLMYSEQD